MAIQPTQNPTLVGPALTHAPCAAGDKIINNGRTWLSVKNADASPHSVTVTSVTNCSYGFNHDLVVAVAAGAEQIIGPFDPTRFNDVNGQAGLAYTSLVSMTIAVLST